MLLDCFELQITVYLAEHKCQTNVIRCFQILLDRWTSGYFCSECCLLQVIWKQQKPKGVWCGIRNCRKRVSRTHAATVLGSKDEGCVCKIMNTSFVLYIHCRYYCVHFHFLRHSLSPFSFICPCLFNVNPNSVQKMFLKHLLDFPSLFVSFLFAFFAPTTHSCTCYIQEVPKK